MATAVPTTNVRFERRFSKASRASGFAMGLKEWLAVLTPPTYLVATSHMKGGEFSNKAEAMAEASKLNFRDQELINSGVQSGWCVERK